MTTRHRPDYAISGMNAAGRVQSIRITDTNGTAADTLEVALTDYDGRIGLPPTGAKIGVKIGWEGALIDRGDFIIDEVEHAGAPDTLTIRGRSADLRQGATRKRTQSWDDTTLGDVIAEIAARLSAEPRITADLAARVVEHIDQTEESDINLITRLAEHHDAIATVKKGLLLFIPRGTGLTASGTAIPVRIIKRSEGDRHRYLSADRDAHTGVVVYWQSNEDADKKEVSAGSTDNPKRLRRTYATEAAAQTAAKSEWQRIQRGTQTVSLTLADGRADIYPETPVRLQGFKAGIDDVPWIIARITHTLSDTQFTTSIECERRAGVASFEPPEEEVD